jgi:hypothetical protein
MWKASRGLFHGEIQENPTPNSNLMVSRKFFLLKYGTLSLSLKEETRLPPPLKDFSQIRM